VDEDLADLGLHPFIRLHQKEVVEVSDLPLLYIEEVIYFRGE
jgi:hypothetical protein